MNKRSLLTLLSVFFTLPCFCQATDIHEATWQRADSLIKTTKEYRKLRDKVNKASDAHLYMMRVTSDSTDAQNKPTISNTVKYDIGVYPGGNPDGFVVVYLVYYSISENKILRITVPTDQ